ncbi:MAG: helix-turn-helix transcriptional regulator [Tepidisphaerales bacterium]
METTMERKLVVDAREAAAMFGKSRSAWLAAVARGDAPYGVRIGGSRRWSVAELEAWLAAGCPGAAAWERIRAAGTSR